MSTDNKDEELFTPNYEDHYLALSTALREQAVPQPSIWDVILAGAEGLQRAEHERERQCALMGEIAVLWVKLIFIDLKSLGIDPDSAQLIVITRLVVDDVPLSPFFKQQLMGAVVHIVDAAHAAAGIETSGEQ